MPIFTKGDESIPSNYRGITIINTVAKIFSLILKNRTNKWCETENKYPESQFGFREKRSTADAVFLLHTTIQHLLNAKCKVWCTLIDYQRAFDTINREFMYSRLISTSVSSKVAKIIRSMYSYGSSCAKVGKNNDMSDFVYITIGLKQGEPLSPLLFFTLYK